MLPIARAVRLATKLQAVWNATRRPRAATGRAWREFIAHLAEARRVRSRFGLAIRHNLNSVARTFRGELAGHLDASIEELARIRTEVAPREDNALDERHWLDEVRQLDDEFGTIEIDWKKHVIRVTTEPVTLRGVELGRFAIVLDWRQLGSSSGVYAIETIALEPNSAAGRDDVVHPHVQESHLCAGDAATPIREAIKHGRLVEAFLLVRAVLTTYNPDSPYVPLGEWDGVACSECGQRISGGAARSCEMCDTDVCDDCMSACSVCMLPRCSSCLMSCRECDSLCCSSCRHHGDRETTCSDCQSRVEGVSDTPHDAQPIPTSNPIPPEELDDEDQFDDLAALPVDAVPT